MNAKPKSDKPMERRAARLAATYADEYNTVAPTLDEIRERKANIDAACAKAGREPIPFTVMTPSSVGKDHPDATDTWINGSVDQVKARLAELEAAGVSGVYLQMQDHRDLEMVERIGKELG